MTCISSSLPPWTCTYPARTWKTSGAVKFQVRSFALLYSSVYSFPPAASCQEVLQPVFQPGPNARGAGKGGGVHVSPCQGTPSFLPRSVYGIIQHTHTSHTPPPSFLPSGSVMEHAPARRGWGDPFFFLAPPQTGTTKVDSTPAHRNENGLMLCPTTHGGFYKKARLSPGEIGQGHYTVRRRITSSNM